MSLLGERLYEEALDVFMEGLVIAERQRLGDRVLSTFHDHVSHTILQLRQQRAIHNFNLVSFACCDAHLTRGCLSASQRPSSCSWHYTLRLAHGTADWTSCMVGATSSSSSALQSARQDAFSAYSLLRSMLAVLKYLTN